MLVQPINNKYNQSFGLRFKLSKETIKAIEESTGLSYENMTRRPLEETEKLIRQSNKLPKPSKIKLWFTDKYKKLGLRLGLLKKHRSIHGDLYITSYI